jgi:hypothetical protein
MARLCPVVTAASRAIGRNRSCRFGRLAPAWRFLAGAARVCTNEARREPDRETRAVAVAEMEKLHQIA